MPLAFKRAHYSSLRVMRGLAKPYDLTPARFDLLSCVKFLRHLAFQANVARALGVSEVTVSKMVRSLEKLGFVRRETRRDSRRRYIRLTNQGRRRYFLALRRLKRKALQRIFETLVVALVGSRCDAPVQWLASISSMLRSAAHALGDCSTLWYPDWDLLDGRP